MSAMFRRGILFAIFLQVTQNVLVQSAQQVQLSDSYLPVAMQVIAHLTDQMAYEVRDEVPKRPSTTTPKPLYVPSGYYYDGGPGYGWWMRYGIARDATTQFHKPGLYAPPFPPKPTDKGSSKNQNFVLLPVDHNSEYTIIEPQEHKTEGPFLSDDDIEVRPLMEPRPSLQHQFLPYDDDIKVYRRSDEYEDEEGLQYLSQSVRDMIRMANDPDDDRLVDVWEGLRASPSEVSTKGKLSSSNLRLLLLYDLLSRDAKKQRLSDFTGFSPEVMKALVESSDGGARAQLAMALDRMVERHDCSHEYANNRAREMVAELARDESLLSSELRYLQPLIYRY